MIKIKLKKILLIVCASVSFLLWYIVTLQRTAVVSRTTPRPATLTPTTTDLKLFRFVPTLNISHMKFILQWTSPLTSPFKYMGVEQNTFLKRRCPVKSCYVTSNRTLFGRSTSKFDAILFHGPELVESLIRIPRRSLDQKYVFVSRESSSNYPICYSVYDDFFNWTWTYRMDSDIYYGYIIIRNKGHEVIGPRKDMNWIKFEEMKDIDNKTMKILRGKRRAAVWIASNCKTNSNRFLVVNLLQIELTKYNLSIDVYGRCGMKLFPKKQTQQMLKYFQKRYYFFLAFENSLNEYYVTEKLLHAMQNYMVPVVYGGANYTRYLPDGSYLVARKDNAQKLAKQMVEAIVNKQEYYDFFRWTNYYSYHYPRESPETDIFCNFCKKLHDVDFVRRKSSHKNFLQWWNFKDLQ